MTSSVGDVTSSAGTAAVALAVLLAASLSQRHLAAVAVAASGSPSFPWRIPIGKNVQSRHTSAFLVNRQVLSDNKAQIRAKDRVLTAKRSGSELVEYFCFVYSPDKLGPRSDNYF